ncbi:TraB/GumN family protein [Methylobrevis pamukkalensis]|uniref:TraB family protein n=1 Tax=Methylobrevis pamukkalensis TaxID=1439726 RepID=A0A1E3GYW8_9HYPH|nr:TraB/GumN family protein [Methylobrevis pamukkalensis]ODN69243.1 TraB family protein [Methylobrevis pamukkalensis]
MMGFEFGHFLRPWRLLRRFALALPFVLPALPAAAEPALWVARDDDSTVYILGTIHVLKPGTAWLTPEIRARFDHADELILEADIRSPMLSVIATLGTSPDRPLSQRLSPDDLAYVKRVAADLGADFPTLDPLRPWLAAVTLSSIAAQNAGYRDQGADLQLLRLAVIADKPVEGFETARQQFEIFAGQSEEEEIAMLLSVLDQAEGVGEIFDDMTGAWLSGDEDNLSRILMASMGTAGPDFRRRLLTDRNRDWADQIAARMKGAGATFVAVGAAHLSGPDSLQHFLAEKGITVDRVDLTGESRPNIK